MSPGDFIKKERQLVIDAAGPYLLVALMEDSSIVDMQWAESREGAGEILTLLAKSGWLEESRFTQVIAGGGPGSYIGLRVALSSSGSLAFAWRTPLILVSSLSAYLKADETSISCLDARAGGVYLQLFEQGVAASPAMRWSDDELKSSRTIGSINPGVLRKLPWRGPHSDALSKRLGSLCNWHEQTPHPYGLVKESKLPRARKYLPPFQGIRLEYLKEDDQVAHRKEANVHG